jgi:hypothetical protein
MDGTSFERFLAPVEMHPPPARSRSGCMTVKLTAIRLMLFCALLRMDHMMGNGS